MRVISQDGNTDVPYENMVLYTEQRTAGGGRYVYDVYATIDWNKCRLLATYRTEKKVKRVLKDLRSTYYDFVYQKVYKTDTKEFSTYFQFPSDEDLEV